MRRTFRVALLLAVFASGLVPAAGRAADDGCKLAEDRPAYVCAGAMDFRTMTSVIHSRGLRVMIFGFEGHGLAAIPEPTTRMAGACILISSRSAYAEMCDLPFDVTIDPLTETATIKGTTKNKKFGNITVDLTVTTSDDPSATPGAFHGVSAGCADATPDTAAHGPVRPGTTSGVVRIGRTTLKTSAAPGWLHRIVSAGGETALSVPCAKERLSGFLPWMVFECLGYYPTEHGLALCRSNSHVRKAEVVGKNKTITVRLAATDMTGVTPTVPDPTWYAPPDGDPTWLSPSDFGAHAWQSLCLIVSGLGFGMAMCGGGGGDGGYSGDFVIEIDPALRTARLKGVIESPFDDFYGFPRPSGMSKALNFGRVTVDLTLTPKDGRPTPVGRTRSGVFAAPCGAGSIQSEMLMHGDGGAEGFIKFQRHHRAIHGTAAKPLPSTMDSSLAMLNFTMLSTPGCEDDMDHEPA